MNIDTLKQKIIDANIKYRSGENSGYTDEEFDNLCENLQSLISIEEFNVFRNSLNEGMLEEYGKKINHKYIAGSLDKIKYETPDEVKSFIRKVVKNKLNVSAKVDGLTGILHYKNGTLIGCATRGDGTTGISIYEKSKYINGIPKTINIQDEIFIRGELVITKNNYNKVEGTSPRNIVAGLINRKEIKYEELSYIDFIAYTIMGPDYPKNTQLDILKNNNFNVVKYVNLNITECYSDKIVDHLFELTHLLNSEYEIDGLVICDTEYFNEEKYRPNNQVAFKTNQQTFETRLIDVDWQGPSKDGRMNCLGILEPCDCGGVIVSKCTLHNLDFISQTGVKIGDIVQITRSGDVIPKFIKVVRTSENSIEIQKPTHCPCCGSDLIQEGPFIYCKNEMCEDKMTYQIMHFIKKCSIENASFKTLKNLKISSIESLLNFKANKKYKSEIKFESELNSKIFTLSETDLFIKLNMKDVGEILLNKIVEYYGWEKIITYDIENYLSYGLPDGIGSITMEKFITSYRKNLKYVGMISSDTRYNHKEKDIQKTKVDVIGSICFTGSLKTMSRTEASKLAESKGYLIKNSVSKGLTYLVTNDKTSGSSKNKKAQQLGTKIINEEEFISLVSDNLISVDDL